MFWLFSGPALNALCLTLEVTSLNSKKNLGTTPSVKQKIVFVFFEPPVSLCVPYIVCGWAHVCVFLFQDIFPHIPAKYFITATKEAH